MEIFAQWLSKKPQYIGFEDVKYAICHKEQYICINTLPAGEQECLIFGTIAMAAEETIINSLLDGSTDNICIIVYGKNCADDSVITKGSQLISLGFRSVYIYSGGLFEWLLLQDIYGSAEFPTNSKCRDPLKYRDIGGRIPRFLSKTIGY